MKCKINLLSFIISYNNCILKKMLHPHMLSPSYQNTAVHFRSAQSFRVVSFNIKMN